MARCRPEPAAEPPVRPAAPPRSVLLRGVRGRSVAAVVGVVGLAILVGVVLLLVVLQRTLVADVEGEAIARAEDVAALVRADGVARLPGVLVDTTRPGQVVQVVDGAGRVVAASTERAQDAPLTSLVPPDGVTAPVRTGRVALLDRDSPFVVVVSAVRAGGQDYRVVVAESIGAQRQSVATVLVLLLVGFPLLLALVAAASWSLVGRALRPVERIRAQVAEIGARGRLDQRVPVPAARDEIGRLAVTMNDMLASLDAARTAQRRFVADAGHELRSPVATISAVLDVAREDSGGATLADLTPVLEAEAARIGRLVDNLLLLARVDEHAVVLETGDVDLDDVVDGEVLRLRAAHPRLRVERVVVPQRVRGDRARLRQVVANLGDNAARHARGVVRLVVAPDPDGALVVVEDDGAGIPPQERERVFGRFVRLDASRGRTSGGSGLGLAIVRELVTAHGGTVTIGDAAGGGCRVEVRLPSRSPDRSGDEDGGQPPSGSSR